MIEAVDPQALLDEVAVEVMLLEGEAGVREVIGIVAALEPVSVRRISRASDLPVPIVAAICGELRKRGVVARERPVQLTPSGRDLCSHLRSSTAHSTACPSCDGRGVMVPDALADVAHELADVLGAAPVARREIDQSHCTVETKLRRALLLNEAGALAGRRILLLGDDDLLSIAIERIAHHNGFDGSIRGLTIIDVDPAVAAFCRARLANAAFPVTVVEHDLRRPLPANLRDGFDTVFTDPPYTPEGAELFLSRAAAAVGRGGNVFLCLGMKPPEDSLRIQTAVAGMGFVIRRLLRNFNEYEGAEALGGTSHLYHLTASNRTRPLIDGSYSGRLYTGDKRRSRRYRCGSCSAIETVGPDRHWKTIGELKAHGCPRCGREIFRPLPRSQGRAKQQVAP
jgi:predicted methyltransferase